MVMTSSITSRKITIFRDSGEKTVAKNRLLIPLTSSEKTCAEIISVNKKTNFRFQVSRLSKDILNVTVTIDIEYDDER